MTEILLKVALNTITLPTHHPSKYQMIQFYNYIAINVQRTSKVKSPPVSADMFTFG